MAALRMAADEMVPLHSLEMEMALLGSIMLDPLQFKLTRPIIAPESFYRPSHRAIYRAICSLDRQGIPTGFEFVIQELKNQEVLHEIGNEDYILQIVEYVPSASSAVHYAKQVAEKAERRAYEQAIRDLMGELYDGTTEIDAIRAKVSALPAAAKRSSAFLDMTDIDESGDDIGIQLGMTAIEEAISTRGYPAGQMSVVSAYHKSGKSTFMVQNFCHMANEGKRVLYATFADLNAKRLKRRMLRCLSGWSQMPKDADLFGDDEKAFQNAKKNIDMLWEARIYDASRSDSETVESFLAQLEAEHLDRPYDCVFIDYAQKLYSDNKRARFGRTSELDWISNRISRSAERLQLAHVVGSQITEGGKEGRTATKGSRAFEEDAGLVLRIKRENQTTATVTIEFSRFGGMGTEVSCYWDPRTLTFQPAE